MEYLVDIWDEVKKFDEITFGAPKIDDDDWFFFTEAATNTFEQTRDLEKMDRKDIVAMTEWMCEEKEIFPELILKDFMKVS